MCNSCAQKKKKRCWPAGVVLGNSLLIRTPNRPFPRFLAVPPVDIVPVRPAPMANGDATAAPDLSVVVPGLLVGWPLKWVE